MERTTTAFLGGIGFAILAQYAWHKFLSEHSQSKRPTAKEWTSQAAEVDLLQCFQNRENSVDSTSSEKSLSSLSTATTHSDNSASEHGLHWNPYEERRGLGQLLCKVNHIAILVTDVGKSLAFYTDILGFQQIRRPNFDRHGAWLTMGNVELHLIKGIPTVHHGDDLVVGHISIETEDVNAVYERLKELGVPFKQNLSVPDAEKSKACIFEGDRTTNATAVVQYFVTDPDGYYIEICNCDILTDFCLNRECGRNSAHATTAAGSHQHFENVCPPPHRSKLSFSAVVMMVVRSIRWRRQAAESAATHLATYNVVVADKADVGKLFNLKARRDTYGDICQGFSEEELVEVLRRSNNVVPVAIAKLTATRGDKKVLLPPGYLDNGFLHIPAPISLISPRSVADRKCM